MQWRELDAVAALAGRELGAPIRLRMADQPADPAGLTVEERSRWRSLRPGPRSSDWLLGRAALRQLMDEIDPASTAGRAPRVSLTHAGGVAIAAACAAGAEGLGIDFEPWRAALDPRAARFFLGAQERDWVAGLPPARRPRALLRLWTVKEALYKATPDNAAVMLADYALADPAAGAGDVQGPGGEALRYLSAELPAGPLALAVCKEKAHAAV